MYFEADQAWKINNQHLLPNGYRNKQREAFSTFEICLNVDTFLVDTIVLLEDAYLDSKQFVCSNIREAIEITEKKHVVEHVIWLLHRKNSEMMRKLSEIQEVMIVNDKIDKPSYLFKCVNGDEYYEQWRFESLSNINIVKVIYSK